MTLDSGLSAVCRDLSRDESLIRGAEPGSERDQRIWRKRGTEAAREVCRVAIVMLTRAESSLLTSFSISL